MGERISRRLLPRRSPTRKLERSAEGEGHQGGVAPVITASCEAFQCIEKVWSSLQAFNALNATKIGSRNALVAPCHENTAATWNDFEKFTL